MQISHDTWTNLERLQEIKYTLEGLKDELDNLPQKEKILTVRTTIKKIEDKKTALNNALLAYEARLDSLCEERQHKRNEMKKIEKDISKSSAHEHLCKESEMLSLLSSQIDKISKDITQIEEKILEGEALREEIGVGLSAYHKIDEELVAEFKHEGMLLSSRIKQTQDAQHILEKNIPDEILNLFHERYDEKKGRALTYFEDTTCQVCKSSVEHAKFSQIVRRGNFIACPACSRLAYIQS
ncbi:MAG: hypothetical protein IJV62_04825 [Eggerthellaceae bacterium]|nr:hypothetical protein [Eggerthellaceae bacterium]